MSLAGKKILVTGGAGVLGQAVARCALAHGAEVERLDVVADDNAALGPCHEVDLLDQSAVAALIGSLEPFHGVANIAGGFAMGPTVAQTSDEEWQFLFDINVNTLRSMLSAVTPLLVAQGRGSIVNVGALGALRGTGHMGAYTAAKSVVMRLTEAQSDEVKHSGVNVNAVLPSLIDTPRNRADMPDADFDTWLKPEDLAEVVCFLLSDRASAVHGALLPVSALV